MYTEFDRVCDEAALGYSFSRRTRLLVWLMKRTWFVWQRSDRAKAWIARRLAATLVPPRG